MRTIIAGSRSITDYNVVKHYVQKAATELKKESKEIGTVISGKAYGVDTLGEKWAKENNIPVEEYPVTSDDWKTYGKKAGHLRNEKMAKVADCVILVWDGKSRGTADMYRRARKHKLKLFLYEV